MLGRYCAVLPASAAAAATCCCHLLLLLPLLLLLVQAYCRCRCWAQRHAPGRRPPREPQRLAHPPARGGRRHRHATARSSRRRSRLYSTYYDAYANMHTRVWCGAERRSTDRVRTSRSRLRNPNEVWVHVGVQASGGWGCKQVEAPHLPRHAAAL